MTQEPNHAAVREEKIKGTGGSIFVRSWRPAGKARAVVVMVPGFNSHSGYYSWVAEQFTTAGIAAYALDLRGRGRSEGERFYVEKADDYVNDVALVVDLARTREAGAPVFMLGHSAGGVVASLYTLEHQAELAGFVCESFAFKVPAPDVALAILKGLSHIAPHLRVLKLKNEDFSRDPQAVLNMNNDPLIADETQPADTMAALVRADERLEEEFPRFTLPLLILHGTKDNATRPSGSQMFYDKARSEDKTLKLYEGHFHDLLNDVDKAIVMSDIKSWIEARLP